MNSFLYTVIKTDAKSKLPVVKWHLTDIGSYWHIETGYCQQKMKPHVEPRKQIKQQILNIHVEDDLLVHQYN